MRVYGEPSESQNICPNVFHLMHSKLKWLSLQAHIASFPSLTIQANTLLGLVEGEIGSLSLHSKSSKTDEKQYSLNLALEGCQPPFIYR